MKQRFAIAALSLMMAVVGHAKEIKIAHVYSRTGPFEAYGVDTQRGFELGLEYATRGTMAVNGKRIVVLAKDDQGKPDLAKSLLQQAYADDKADIAAGPTVSTTAMAMLPVAEEYKKILLINSAVSDSITGANFNRYIFRSGRNSSMDAISQASVLDKPNVHIATLAQDYAFGREGMSAFKSALKQARVVHQEFLPIATTDFTAAALRIREALKDKPGKKLVYILWAGTGNPFKIFELSSLKEAGIKPVFFGNTIPMLHVLKPFIGTEGATYYYYAMHKNPINDWFIKESYRRYKSPPDFFSVCGFISALAIVEALKKTGGDTDTEKLITAMEGMSVDTPKGKITFRKEDHQALQSMFHFKLKHDPAIPWAVLDLVREIKPEEMDIPVNNKHAR